MAPRLSRDARREQLISVAYELLKREGTDVLTLGRLAERAGVSKPIAYDHFGTRAGLLTALFRSVDARQVEQMRTAMSAGGDSLEAATEMAAAGYLNCLVGPEYEDLCAALLAYEETKDYLRESRAYFAEAYGEVFAPFVALDGAQGRALLIGLVGAAEALAREMHDERLGAPVAIEALATLMLATLEPFARPEQRRTSPEAPSGGSPLTLDEGAP